MSEKIKKKPKKAATKPKVHKLDVGRPTKFKDLNLKKVEELAKRGWTDAEMSSFFGVHLTTWKVWKGKHKKFKAALSEWKHGADRRVERTLYEKAIGYTFLEEKIFCNKDGVVTRVEVLTHVPPSDRAIQYWLNNRQPEDWRHHQSISVGVDGDLGELMDAARKRANGQMEEEK